MTDLESFIDLYKRFGVDIKSSKDHDYEDTDGDNPYISVILSNGSGDCFSVPITESDKFNGYSGFYTHVKFSLDGKFISQGFWE